MSKSVSAVSKEATNPRKRRQSQSKSSAHDLDSRRRLEERLEDLKLQKELKEFDFEYS